MWHWDSEKAGIVRKLYPTHSASVIAAMIGEKYGGPCTRNSIIGIAYRIGLKKGAGSHSPHELKQKRPAREVMMKIKPKPEWKPQPQPSGPPVRGIQCPCQTIELEQYNCRWPYGDPREEKFYFCGAVVSPDRQYCPTHLKIANHARVDV